MQQSRNPREGRAWILTDQGRSRTRVRGITIEDYDRRMRRGQFAPVPRFGQESDRPRVCVRERPDTLDESVGIAAKLAAKSNSEFPERNGHDLDYYVAR